MAAIEAAKSAFVGLTQADLREAKENLAAAVPRLDAKLDAAGEVSQGWREYLMWEKMRQELAKEEPDLAVFDAVYLRYTSGRDGLQYAMFDEVRGQLRQYLVVARAIDDKELESRYRQILELLAARLTAYSENPNPDDAQVISDAIRWLREAEQAGWIVEAVRRRFGAINLSIGASSDLIAAMLGKTVDEVTPVEDCILGTAVRGTGHAVGAVSVELIPSDAAGAIDMILRSDTATNTIGYNGPVRIYSDGTTRSASRKRLLLTGEGLSPLPAVTSAVTDNQIRGISAGGRRLIEKFARRTAARQEPLAEQIAARHAERQISDRFDEQAAEQAANANRDYQDKIRRPMVLRGLFPPILDISTTRESLQVEALQASAAFHLAASTAPPATNGKTDLSVRVHESAINNYAEGFYGGRIVSEEQMQQDIADLLGYLPDRFKSPAGEELWSIAFAERQPISVAFQSGGFRMTIRGDSYTKGQSEYPGMIVTAHYRIENSSGDFRAVRQGELEIFPPGFSPDGGQRLSTREQVLRSMLQRRFNEVFPGEIVPEPIVPTGDQAANVGKLVLEDWQATPGWMILGWKRVPPEPEAAGTSTVAANGSR
ncbi:MAG: hypothetical protein GXY83_23175 [Rhodopirellula sp.]|nr:hypothetical protein [Rhodopirellula sp.]